MHFRFSIPGTVVAGIYLAVVLTIVVVTRDNPGLGFGVAVASFPEFFLLGLIPTPFFYTPLWQDLLIFVFAFGAMGLNALILYSVCGGLRSS